MPRFYETTLSITNLHNLSISTHVNCSRINTTDSSFTPVNEFCMDLRIAGKPFGLLTVEELQSLIPKLEAILRKPKIRNTQCAVSIPLIIRSNQLPS